MFQKRKANIGIINIGAIIIAIIFLVNIIFIASPFRIEAKSETNLALNKTVTVSSSAGDPASYAVDGNTSTAWCASSDAMPQWIKIDLGASYAISSVTNKWGDSDQSIWKYKIEGSVNNTNWTVLADRTSGGVAGPEFNETVTGTYRYVRLTITSNSALHWAHISEIGVYGGEAEPTPPPAKTNLGLNKTITVSSTAGGPASYAVDGDASTSWCASSDSMPQWIKVDLGASYTISSVTNKWGDLDQSIWKYKIEGSVNNTNWTVLADRTSGGVAGPEFNETVTGTYRYVRLTITGNSALHWAHISEIGIYGDATEPTPTPTPTLPADASRLYVDGNLIKSTPTQRFIFKGCALYAMPYYLWNGGVDVTLKSYTDTNYENRDAIFDKMVEAGINTVRLPLSIESYNTDWYNLGGKDGYLQRVANVVASANSKGLYVIIGWWDSMFAGADLVNTYSSTFQMYEDVYHKLGENPMVMYEPHNEPNNVSWNQWQTIMKDTVYQWRTVMGYKGILFIDTVNYSGDFHSTYATNLINYEKTLNNNTTNIVFANHRYANSNSSFSGTEKIDWDIRIGDYVGTYPIMGTEYGFYNHQGDPQPQWNIEFLDYLAQTKVSQGFNGLCEFVWDWVDGNDMTDAGYLVLNQHGNITKDHFYSAVPTYMNIPSAPSDPTPTPTPDPTPTPVLGPNLVQNSEFNNGTANWNWEQISPASGNISVVTNAGLSGAKALKTVFTNGGVYDWQCQISQALPLSAGKKYVVKFMGLAEEDKIIRVTFQQSTSPYNEYWSQTFKVTSTASTQTSLTFNCNITDPDARLKFIVGGDEIPLYIDKVEVHEVY